MKKTKEEILTPDKQKRLKALHVLNEHFKYEPTINHLYDSQIPLVLDAMEEYATQQQSEAVELLQELFDLQNGPPLETYRKQWEEAMDKISIYLKDKGCEG